MAERTAARAAVTPIDVNALLAERPVAGLAAHHPTMRERFGNAIYDLARWGGLGSIAHRMRQQGGLAADFLPGLGDVLALEDAAQDYGKGNYGMAAAGLGLAALGLVPGVGDLAAKGAKKGIRAFHGSPHDFDKFRLDKIGTGEGAQAYGHGLYFAENEGVARNYRDALAASQMLVDGKPFRPKNYAIVQMVAESKDRADFTDILKRYIRNEKGNPYSNIDDVETILSAVERGTFAVPSPGRMYEVNINADPDDFLDWDKPLSEQSEKVQTSLKKQIRNWDQFKGKTGGEYVEYGLGKYGHESILMKDDIPGIKYLDQGSRGKWNIHNPGNGKWEVDNAATGAIKEFDTRDEAVKFLESQRSRNYVVFDENLIEIVKKYGLAGAVAAGLISQEMAQQMQAQGMGEL